MTVADGTRDKDKGLSRRGFLRTMMWVSAGLVLLESALAGLAMFWPRKVEGFGSVIRAGHVNDFPPGTITRVRDGKFYISHLPEGLMALYWKCPHLGCTVPWAEAEDRFACPCHASIYLRTGQNVAGPAPRPMDYMDLTIADDGSIFVDTGKVYEREAHRTEHVTEIPSSLR